MERSYRDSGRSSYGDLDDYRAYRRQEGSSYLDRELEPRDSFRSSSASSFRSGRSYADRYDRDVMETLLQQRALQQQLSLRESQLALANSLLHQQQQQQQFFNKRRMDPRSGDFREDFKRPRMMDNRSRPRSRSTGGRDSMAGGRGAQGGPGNRRNSRTSRGRGRPSSDKPSSSKDSNDPEKPSAEAVRKHDGDISESKGHCNICDVSINVNMLSHQRQTFHKKRRNQVTKGCGWCNVTSFKNFTEVLEHRATEEHIKNQELHDKRDPQRRNVRGEGRSRRREALKIEMPPELKKFDPKVAVGQSCVISVTGWFCKLCNKFYNNENAAKETHCMTEDHFHNFKKFTYTKLRAKAEEERDAKEKAEKEKKKAKEAEDKEGGGDDEQTTELVEGDEEMAEGEQVEGAEENGVAAEGEEDVGGAEEEGVAEEMEMGTGEEEEGGYGMMGEAEEYGGEGVLGELEEGGGEGVMMVEGNDEAAAAAAYDIMAEGAPDESADQAGAECVDTSGQEEPQAIEESEAKGEAEEEEEDDEEEEETEDPDKKKATRAAVSSPGRGRGRGGAKGRRGRRVAK